MQPGLLWRIPYLYGDCVISHEFKVVVLCLSSTHDCSFGIPFVVVPEKAIKELDLRIFEFGDLGLLQKCVRYFAPRLWKKGSTREIQTRFGITSHQTWFGSQTLAEHFVEGKEGVLQVS